MNTIYIFITLAGFIIGLGAVTVIDIHGFLGRKSSYWTEATTRTHKITKPLIWLGMVLLIIGLSFLYENQLLLSQYILFFIMIINGMFLSFSVSPYLLQRERKGQSSDILPKPWQTKITISFILSFISWWGSVLLFAYYLQHMI